MTASSLCHQPPNGASTPSPSNPMDGEFDASRLGAYLQSHPVGYRPSGSAPAHRVRFQLTLKPACVADLYINRLVAQHSALIPRARRAHLPRQRRSRRPGVLPARGSMDAQFRDVLGDGPHPTSAGSTVSFDLSYDGVQGSSPRARGALRRAHGSPWRSGFIPAGAGSTLVDQHVLRWPSWFSFTFVSDRQLRLGSDLVGLAPLVRFAASLSCRTTSLRSDTSHRA